MEPLWILPAVIVVIGLGVLTQYVRGLGTAAEDLRLQFERLGELQVAVHRLRDESAAARARRLGRS